jgi:hypothetical protein
MTGVPYARGSSDIVIVAWEAGYAANRELCVLRRRQ